AIAAPRGVAIQMRVNLESLQADGQISASQGTITAYDLPCGPGIRVDGFGTVGYTTSLAFDALLAKIIVHCPSAQFAQAMRSASRALDQTVIAGITTNLPVLRAILRHPQVIANDISTRWIDQNTVALLTQAQGLLGMDAQSETPTQPAEHPIPAGTIALRSPTAGTLIALDLEPGERVHAGQTLAVIEAMKMQHVLSSPASGVVRRLDAASGQMLSQDQPILLLEPDAADATVRETSAPIDPDRIRPDLAAALARHALTLDHARPDAIARRHASLGRSARENIEDLVDPDSFIEYGALAIAAQRSRHAVEQLQRTTPADGLVAGIATVNWHQFAAHHASQHASQHAPRHAAREADPADDGRSAEITRTVVMAYDYTVLAGTQGAFNHQ
ncbi:MAG: carbamoyl-phosphate synthase large subunit, partial [Betaproteobacteria bacterium]|nr:carbamoyl-phosphate synthase large subunit [Betaproteobacteria bacterium]